MKIFTRITIIVLLLISAIFQGSFSVQKVKADTPKFHVLEIVDNGGSKLVNVLDKNFYEITTVRMKEFVAERKDIDGLYDAIYIGEGNYNPGLPVLDPNPYSSNSNLLVNTNRGASHNTTNVMNDITKLKADEIMRYYVNKGLPLILHNSVGNQTRENNKRDDRKSILKDTFFASNIQSLTNVFVIQDVRNFPKNAVELTNKPKLSTVDVSSTSQVPTANTVMKFKFKVLKGNPSQLTANLYIDLNYNNRYSQEEILVSKRVTSLSKQEDEYELTYRLPKGYSGPRFWKFEIVDQSNLKDIKTGSFGFKGEKVKINILQVTPDNGTGNLVNVLSSIPEKTNNIIQTDEFKMEIDTVTMSNFTKPRLNRMSYDRINDGYYNMIVFGFKDQYGDQSISQQAASALREYVETGQGLFLTHDTFRRDRGYSNKNDGLYPTNNWLKYLFDLSGQNYEIRPAKSNTSLDSKLSDPGKYFLEQNFGRNGVATTTNTKQVNKGLLTEYPYELSEQVAVANTHSQYFAINLEDPDVTPWYNLNSTHRDNDDSWNHYYIYSYKNITYSGAGHTTNDFKQNEQKLFVNTLYRSFLSANHQPEITVLGPDENEKVPSYQDVNITYKIEDLDLVDRYLKTKLYIDDELVLERNGLTNGSIVSHMYQHGLNHGGTIEVKIEATDQKGAKRVETFEIEVEEVEADFQLSRSISSTLLKVDQPYKIQYTVKPKEISLGEQAISTSMLRPIALFANHITESQIGKEIVLLDSTDLVNAEPITFGGDQSANVLENRIENGVREDVPNDTMTISELNKYGFEKVNGKNLGPVIDGLEKISPNETFYLPVIDSNNYNTNKIVNIAAFTNRQYNNRQGNNADVKATFLGFVGGSSNVSREVQLNFTEEFPSGISIGNITGLLNENQRVVNGNTIVEATLPKINYTRGTNGQYTAAPISFEIEITPKEPKMFELANSFVYDQNDENEQFDFAPLQFEAKHGLSNVAAPEKITLYVGGDSLRVPLVFEPENAEAEGMVKHIEWSLVNTDIATIDTELGILTGTTEGTTTLKVKVEDIFGTLLPAENEWLEIEVEVINPLNSISAPEEIELFVGETIDYNVEVQPSSARDNLRWEIGDHSIINVDKQNGKITAKKAGETTITLTGTSSNGETITKITRVRVKQKVEGIIINPQTITLNVDETYNLNDVDVNILPNDATNKAYEWEKNSNSIIEFIQTNGPIFKATNPGNTTIKVKSEDRNAEAELNVVVLSPLVGIEFRPNTLQVRKGDSVDLSGYLKRLPENTTTTGGDIKYRIGNSSLARVKDDGQFFAKRLGTVTVTAELKVGNQTFEAEMTIKIVDQNDEADNGDLY
ncbi:DUF5057 domain-containing protein [Cytobacillus sp. FJAT-54145]|uniref:DUF5057 domain-containing protein n=1 Tax=Cytobacillus spartinae TaxID=3299023 RepID=A0ABW6KIM4_9BACI